MPGRLSRPDIAARGKIAVATLTVSIFGRRDEKGYPRTNGWSAFLAGRERRALWEPCLQDDESVRYEGKGENRQCSASLLRRLVAFTSGRHHPQRNPGKGAEISAYLRLSYLGRPLDLSLAH